MSGTPQITTADIRALLDSPAEQPALYIELDEDDGTPGNLAVWAEALVPHHTVVLTREQAEDLLGDAPSSAAIAGCLPDLQQDADEIYAAIAESIGHA
ncbi:hypothetical protein [Streptomyces sp.]|uniref:hypothetical protein n=1 Tax=Streptomyces sp. TaxID=1931 RepID=UPI002F42FABA